MLTDAHIKEALSMAYVRAVAARAGAGIRIDRDEIDYGIDGTFQPIEVAGNRRFPTGYPLDFQLKATVDWAESSGSIGYELDADTYNNLALRSRGFGSVPAILLVFCMPRDPKRWLEQDQGQLALRKCCYWHLVNGAPTPNTSSVTIRIPALQLFTSATLSDLLARTRKLLEQGKGSYGAL